MPTPWGSPPSARHCTTPFRERYRRLPAPCLRLPPESLSVPGRALRPAALLSRGRGCLPPTPPRAPTHPVPAPSWSGGTSNRMRTWAAKASLLPGEMRACMQTRTCSRRGGWAWRVPTEHTQTPVMMVPNTDWVDSIVPPFVPQALTAGRAPPTPWITPLCTGRSPETASYQRWVPKPLPRPLTEWPRCGWLTSTADLLTACPPMGFRSSEAPPCVSPSGRRRRRGRNPAIAWGRPWSPTCRVTCRGRSQLPATTRRGKPGPHEQIYSDWWCRICSDQDDIIAWKHGLTLHPGVNLTTSLVFHFIIWMPENNPLPWTSESVASTHCFERLFTPSGIHFIVELTQTSRRIETGAQPDTRAPPTACCFFFPSITLSVVLSTNFAAEPVQIGHAGGQRFCLLWLQVC